MVKVKHVRVADVKTNGIWFSYRSEYIDGCQTLYTSDAQELFNHVKSRCNKSSRYVEKFPTYKDCVLGFTDFQHFAEWCNTTPGYKEQHDNKQWCLDKDILIMGNKTYSPYTCCFVPEFVNNFFVISERSRGIYPAGVTKCGGRSKRYRSRCYVKGVRQGLGNFLTPEEAHFAWVEAKAENLQYVIDSYWQLEGSEQRVVDALEGRYEYLMWHLVNKQVVTSL